MLHRCELPYEVLEPEIYDDYDLFAWNGHWLATIEGAAAVVAGDVPIDIWQIGPENELERFDEILPPYNVRRIKWNGDRLFIGDSNGNIYFWSRGEEEFRLQQKLECEKACVRDLDIDDFIFRGNQLIVSCPQSITVWEQDETRVFFHKIYNLYVHEEDVNLSSLCFHAKTIFSTMRLPPPASKGQRIRAFEFLVSNEHIFRNLAQQFETSTRGPGLDLLTDRFIRMPTSQIRLIFKEFDAITQAEWSRQMAQAIRNILDKYPKIRAFVFHHEQILNLAEQLETSTEGPAFDLLLDSLIKMPKIQLQFIFHEFNTIEARCGQIMAQAIRSYFDNRFVNSMLSLQ